MPLRAVRGGALAVAFPDSELAATVAVRVP